MTPLDLFLRICFAGFSLILLFVSISAYRRYGEGRLAIVAGAFSLFSLTSILILVSTFIGWEAFDVSPYLVALNIGILLCLYFAIIKR